MRLSLISFWVAFFILSQAHAQEVSKLPMPVGAVIQEATPIERGVQSIYMQLPGDGQAIADLSFSAGSMVNGNAGGNSNDPSASIVERNTQFTAYDFNYLYGISDSFQFGLNAGFMKSSTSNTDGSTGSASIGMRDMGLTLQRSSKEENHTLVYGLASLISPEPSPAVTKGTTGSNFSGATTISPFAAYQTRFTHGVIGAKLATNFLVRQSSYDSSGFINNNSGIKKWDFDLTGFYEFPVHRLAKIGLALNLESDETILRNAATYSSELYCGIKIVDDTMVRASASGFSYSQGSNNISGTEISLALRTML
jgi:hypothetical protein